MASQKLYTQKVSENKNLIYTKIHARRLLIDQNWWLMVIIEKER